MPRVQPSSPEASRRMAKVRQKGTGAEVALRRELHQRGLRYRVDYEVLKKPRRVADIAFPCLMIAIFVDGCFWHGCPEHATWPKSNAEFWRQKIETNRVRDDDTNQRLQCTGWIVLRFWEHELPNEAADVVVQAVAMGRSKHRASPPNSHNKN
ncbi:very short patch repair endonuclease [Aeromonas media]|uniref:very short patch repair endonuclease n=1 Tax=Aeromonas TaxID=642 RepID=UPI00370AE562